MTDRVVLWADLALAAYNDLSGPRRAGVDAFLAGLAAADDPTRDLPRDPVYGWWVAFYADGTGMLFLTVSPQHHTIVVIRLIDAE